MEVVRVASISLSYRDVSVYIRSCTLCLTGIEGEGGKSSESRPGVFVFLECAEWSGRLLRCLVWFVL